MARRFVWYTFIVVFLVLSVSCSRNRDGVLLIGAASSFSDVMDALVAEYRLKHDIRIETTYAASGVIYTQIMKGAPVDIYISADKKYLGMLEDSGKAEDSMVLCRNNLVFAVNSSVAGSSGNADPSNGIIKRIGIGNPAYSPAGRYAVSLLKTEGIYSKVQSKLVLGNNVRQVLSWLDNGDVDAGFIYKTDSLLIKNIRIAGQWDNIAGETIDYPAIRISSGKSAVEFMKFLGSAEARRILSRFGFGG